MAGEIFTEIDYPGELVIVIRGSDSDKKFVEEKVEPQLDRYGLAYVNRVSSAHKSTEELLAIVAEYEARTLPTVILSIVGLSAAKPGTIDTHTTHPVFYVPAPNSDNYGYVDVFSGLRSPSDVSPAAILRPDNAAMAIARIFGESNPTYKQTIRRVQTENREGLIVADRTALLTSRSKLFMRLNPPEPTNPDDVPTRV